MTKKLTLSLCLSCLLFQFAVAQPPKKIKMGDTVSVADRLYCLSTLWKEAAYNFVWFDKQPALNWDSTYQAYIPKILKAKNVFETNRVLTKFLEELKDGHTAVWANQGFWDEIDQPPMNMTRIDGKLYVYRIAEKLKEKLPIKSEVQQINGQPASDFLKNDYWLGFKGTTVVIDFKDPNGKVGQITLTRNLNDLYREGGFNYYPAAPTAPNYKFKHSEPTKGISLVEINTFSDPALVDSFKNVLPKLQQDRALIIDLRNNGGGNSDNALQIAKIITDQPFLVGPSWKTRIHNAANKAWGSFNKSRSDGQNYQFKEYAEMNAWESHSGDTVILHADQAKLNRPVVLLTSKKTYSAAEDFLIYLLGSKNITRIGQPSAGSSGQPLTITLPLGITARICAKRDALPDGTNYIGVGIAPDIYIQPTPLFTQQKEDLELKAALAHLNKLK